MADTLSTAACLLVLPTGEMVFQRRTKDAPISPRKLSLFGGHIKHKEAALHAVKREIAEETSISAEQIHVRHIGSFRAIESNGVIHLYAAHILKPGFRVFEGERYEIYSPDEILAREDVDKDARLAIEKFLAAHG